MAQTSDFIAHVLDLLSSWGGVSVRRMFGGHGVYRQGVMFALVTDDTLYFKTDDRNRPDFVAAGMRPFAFTKKKRAERIETSYWQTPPELFDDAEEMVRWAERALKAARAPRARKMTKN